MAYEIMFASFTFFSIMRYLITRFTIPDAVQHKWRWYNVWISWIHALCAGLGCIYCVSIEPTLLNNLQDYDIRFAYNLIEMSTGYFWYDAIDVGVLSGSSLKESLILLCHHFVVILCFTVVVVTGDHVPIAIVCLLVEINSIFLHARQIFRMAKIYDGPFYTVNKIFNIITFFMFRFVSLSWMLRRVILDRSELSIGYFILLVTSFPLMIVINFGLFLQVLAKDVPAFTVLQKLQGSKNQNRKEKDACETLNGHMNGTHQTKPVMKAEVVSKLE